MRGEGDGCPVLYYYCVGVPRPVSMTRDWLVQISLNGGGRGSAPRGVGVERLSSPSVPRIWKALESWVCKGASPKSRTRGPKRS